MSSLLKWLVLPCSLTLFLGCHDDKELVETVPENTARRTVLMYVSAQNSLGHLRFQEADSIEIVNGRRYIDDDDRMLVYMDDAHHPRIYQYTRHDKQPKLVRSWNFDANSSSPETLKEVLTWIKTNYPANEYGLVMWSHSDGWLPSTNKNYRSVSMSPYSFGIDVGKDGSMKYDEDANGNIGSQMDIEDMATAIKNSGIHFQYIFFDSCLMQTLESGYSLRGVTDYIIGGPMQIPGCGANYTNMLKKGLFTEAEYDIVDTYYENARDGIDHVGNEYYGYGVVISSLRTDKLESLARTTADVLSRSSVQGRHSADLSDVLNYQAYCYDYFYRPHHYDAQEAMKKILNEEDFKKYKTALNEVIVNKHATHEFWIGPSDYDMKSVNPDHFCGVATFIPQKVYTQKSSSCIYGDLNKVFRSTSWYKAAGWESTGW